MEGLLRNRLKAFSGSDRGAVGSTLDLMIGTAVGFILLGTVVPWWMQTQVRQTMDQTTAQEIRNVSTALSGYIKAYASNIEGVATATKPAVITVPMLVNTGFLPGGTNAVDPYGQTIVGEVLQPNPGYLVGAVVTQGGRSPSGSHISQLATLIGTQGGFVPPSDLAGFPGVCGTNCFQGAGNAWQATFAQYPFTGVGPGSLIALQQFNANNLPQDFLYRSSVPGFPQANQMQASINMNGNNLNNANAVNTYNLNSPNGTVNLDGNTVGNASNVQTYNLTSPNGTVSTQNLSTGQINTNGQAITSGQENVNPGTGCVTAYWAPDSNLRSSNFSWFSNPCGGGGGPGSWNSVPTFPTTAVANVSFGSGVDCPAVYYGGRNINGYPVVELAYGGQGCY